MTELEAIEDATQSIIDSFKAGSKVVSLNPVTVHRDTLVDVLYKKRLFSPPWLWSVLEVLKRIAPEKPTDAKIVCEPVAKGKDRGSHNCGACDFQVAQEIDYYSLQNEFSPGLKSLKCPNNCNLNWEWILENENFIPRDAPIFSHRWHKKKLNLAI
jgi:hypothetical protein